MTDKQEEKESKKPVDKKAQTVTVAVAEYESLKNRLEELEGLKDKLMRTAADFENAKKRLAREKEEFVRFNQERILGQLLPVLDNFQRAMDHSEEVTDTNARKIINGIEMVLKQLNEILKSQGVKKVESVGQPFDPNLHEAVGYVQDDGKEDEVVDEIQTGYLLHDRLLRAAKVRVRIAPAPAQKPDGESKSDEEEEEIT